MLTDQVIDDRTARIIAKQKLVAQRRSTGEFFDRRNQPPATAFGTGDAGSGPGVASMGGDAWDQNAELDGSALRRMRAAVTADLLRGVLVNSICALQDWSDKWRIWRDRRGKNPFVTKYRIAVEADAWFMAPHQFNAPKLTCRDVCDALDLHHGQVVEKLYATLDANAVAVLRVTSLAAAAIRRAKEQERIKIRRKAVIRAAVAFLEIVGARA